MECAVDLMFCLNKEGDLFVMVDSEFDKGLFVADHVVQRNDGGREASYGPESEDHLAVRGAIPYAAGSAALHRPIWATSIESAGAATLLGHEPETELPGAVSRALVDEIYQLDPRLEELMSSIG